MPRFLRVRPAFGPAVLLRRPAVRSALSFGVRFTLGLAVLALLVATGVRAQEPAARFAPDRLIVRFAEPLTFEPGLAAPRWGDPALADLAAASGVVGARPLFPARAPRGAASATARRSSVPRRRAR